MGKKFITVTTDFGTKDVYVGVMKGVILSINPDVTIVDITHEIEAGNIKEASFLLKDAYSYFPKGTIHVAVVDPGVGGKRRAIAVRSKGYFFVGPDNGIFWQIIKDDKDAIVVHLKNKKYFLAEISSTFHGRDIFAPVAAHISKDVDIRDMGDVIDDPVRLEIEKPKFLEGKIIGCAIREDNFGNIITNISKKDIIRHFHELKDIEVIVGDKKISQISRTYSDVGKGELLALIGSSGFLEISANMKKASEIVGKNIKELRIEIRKKN